MYPSHALPLIIHLGITITSFGAFFYACELLNSVRYTLVRLKSGHQKVKTDFLV